MVLHHATLKSRLGKIKREGLKPRQAPFVLGLTNLECKISGISKNDCGLRLKKLQCKEDALEERRQLVSPELPSRADSVFFGLAPEHWKLENGRLNAEVHNIGVDKKGKPLYDFGSGRDVLLAVNEADIDCKCAIGPVLESELVKESCDLKLDPTVDKADRDVEILVSLLPDHVRDFWEDAREWVPGSPIPQSLLTPMAGPRKAEVWCPCSVSPDKITVVAESGKNQKGFPKPSRDYPTMTKEGLRFLP